MADLNKIFTRLQLKYDTLANWQAVKDTFTPLAGEVCIAKVEVNDPANKLLDPVMIKVGDGTSTWGQLDWVSAKAADVYSWAKKSEEDFITWVNEQIEHPDPTVDTNDNTVYRFEIKDGKFGVYKTEYTLGEAGEETLVDEYDLVTPDELTEVLKAYYTSAQVDELVKDKLHTQEEIETIAANKIGALISAADDPDDKVLANIADLVNYVEENASDIAQLVSDVNIANTNASNAVNTANGAAETAGQALEKANEALEGAEGAAASAAAAKASEDNAKASENAAAGSANAAAASATTAGEQALAAQGSAEAAAQSALNASGSAENAATSANTASTKAGEASTSAARALASEQAAAQSKADAEAAKGLAETAATNAGNAQTAAEAAQGKAETAQGKAEAAQVAAEAAKTAAEDANTSATAIANEAKETADAAKEASDAATEAVAGLHAIATSGSIYDVAEGNNTSVGTDAVKYLVFNCGTASTVI